ncbi:MAG TPA: hypothetical protein VNL71_11080 [Chloroflexota bacterium]|nr:hypothetical protein [Chloroflexota bacterium]
MSSNPGQLNPQVDHAKQMFLSLSLGRRIALVAGVVGLIVSFLHWYTASYSASFGGAGLSESTSISGWHGWGIVAVLLLIVSGVVAVLPLIGITSVRALVPSLPPTVTDAMVLMGAGVIAVLTTILFMTTEGSGVSGPGYSEGPSFGAYIGLICGIAVAAGGYLMRSEPAA